MTQDTRSLETLASALGWLSVGLGAVEMAAPHAMARRIGLKNHDRLLQLYGAREVATGIGLLTAPRDQKPLWLWGRVAGDALDVLTLTTGMTEVGPYKRQRAALALGAVVGVAALDALCAWKLGEAEAMRRKRPVADYSRRSGFPRGVETARGSARDAELPQDMLTPDALRPYAVP